MTAGRAYTYQVIAVVDGGEATRSARLTVTATANQKPAFVAGTSTTRRVAENTATGVPIGDPVTATDLDDATLTYSLGGSDAAAFTLNTATGQLQTKAAPVVTLRLSSVSISENGGQSTVTAELDEALEAETMVTVSGTPVAPATGQDFAQAGTTLRIAAGVTHSTGAVTLTARNNTVDAQDKTVEVRGSATNSAHPIRVVAAPLTITDDDPPEVRGEIVPGYVGRSFCVV